MTPSPRRAAKASRTAALALLSAALVSIVGAAGERPAWQDSAAHFAHFSWRLRKLPRVTVWAWERREDLRDLDPQTTAVAFLDRTVLVGADGVVTIPRRQPMLLPASDALIRIAVVRIEAGAGAALNSSSAETTARAVIGAAAGGVAALQVDFDARQSQRAWYADVLRRVRAQMPAAMPLSITALASWCSYDGGWIATLPVDEAVPMLFRMEPDRRLAAAQGGAAAMDAVRDFTIREPLCLGSVGISTTEAWPRSVRDRRVYVFADRGWSRDGLQQTVRSLE